MLDTLILQELKRLILVKNEINIISSSDCINISVSIQKETKKKISETTIKRLFGFAEIKHKFSKFTINTLIEYIAYLQPSSLVFEDQVYENDHEFVLLKKKAETITNNTLQSIRHRCSVPYKMTIPRKFANYDYIFFRTSKYSFTVFISQPSYGKSILLSHLTQEMFYDENAPYKKDVVVFFLADSIFSNESEELSLEDRIKIKIGLQSTTDLVSFFNEQWKKYGIKLNIIIDGFSEISVYNISQRKIVDNILNLISSIGDTNCIKLILSMRSTTWNRFYEIFRYLPYLNNKWFAGSYLIDSVNIPPLTEIEVEKIFNKISPKDFSKISKNLKSHLKFPFKIQWYCKLKEEYPDFESYTNIINYEIIALFIKEKIYNSNYATEKAIFCQKIIHLTNYGRKGYSVNKTDLLKQIPVFHNAYEALLADGILMEETQQNNNFLNEQVRFIQPDIYEYFLFVELYELFNNTMDKRFFETVNNEYIGNQVHFQLLQWSARLMVKLYKFNDLKALLNLKLNNYEKNYLIYFIAESLFYNKKSDPELLNQIKEQQLHKLLISQFIHFDFIDSSYKESINCLIEIAETPETQLLYHSILSIFDCMSLNLPKIFDRLEKMEKLVHEASNWELNPYEVTKVIYLKLKGIPVKNSEILDIIESYKADEQQIKHGKLPNTKQVINILQSILVNLFYGSPADAAKITNSTFRIFPKLLKTRSLFSVYILSLMVQANARVNPGKKTDQMENVLINLLADSRINATSYTQCLLLSIRAEQCRNRNEYDLALQYAEECLHIYKRNDLAIHKILTYNLIINIYIKLGNLAKVEEYNYKKMYLLKSKKINSPIFQSTSLYY